MASMAIGPVSSWAEDRQEYRTGVWPCLALSPVLAGDEA